MADAAAWVRPHILEMAPYEPVRPFEVLSRQLGLPPERIRKLDANENPYGVLPAVRQALADLKFAHIYPDPESTALRQALAEHTGLPMDCLLAGAGADELIDLLMRLCLDPGDRVLVCPPTFGMYAFDAALQNARVVAVPRRPDFSLDLEAALRAIERERPKLVFLASPNNPDGGLLPDEALEALLATPALVVLDEAYVEFAPPGASRLALVPERDNLVVLRTFSKWAGLAGLRVGYGTFPRALMPHLWKIKQPYNVSVAATAAALAALAHAEELRAIGARIVAERERLAAALAEVPYLQPYPSQANFVLCRVLGRPAKALQRALAARGILVRHFDRPGLDDHIRISVGRPEATEVLLAVLKELE